MATLSLTFVLPPDSLGCGLETRWQKLFASKNEKAIKAIQDAFQCCGFHNVKDRAWPFGINHPSVCGDVFGRSNGCLEAWRKAEQIDAGLFVVVAGVVFSIKVWKIFGSSEYPNFGVNSMVRMKLTLQGSRNTCSSDQFVLGTILQARGPRYGDPRRRGQGHHEKIG